jgi:aminoglycoside phosphotransferase (APT) family kinase protein
MNTAELADALGEEPQDLARLGGGAGRCEMWSLSAGGRRLVFRSYPSGFDRDQVRLREWRVLQLAHDRGVPVPAPVALTPTGFVVERVEGEARPQRLLGDERWASARETLVARVAEAAARLHRIEPPDFLPHAMELDGPAPASSSGADGAVATLEQCLDRVGEPHPAIELGLRWLRLNVPPPAPPAIVHGDLRLSNLVVGDNGQPTLIDWELVHAGDGAEDLGWMCVRSWRFGAHKPALGCGSREELLDAYAAAGAPTPKRHRPLAGARDDRAANLRGRVGPARAAGGRARGAATRAHAPGCARGGRAAASRSRVPARRPAPARGPPGCLHARGGRKRVPCRRA